MSCPNSTAPIDISDSNVAGKCEYKCSYKFHYNDSNCVATNRGNYISISYDKSSTPPVKYNSVGYDVQESRLYIPSLHTYNNSRSDGELVVVHRSNTGSNPLLVCIPIQTNNTSSASALLLETIVATVANNAPSEDESTTVPISSFNLNAIIPQKPFYSYTATEPYQPCSSETDYVVFSTAQVALDMKPSTLQSLQNIIENHPYTVASGPLLFYNEKGSTQGGTGEIYIDCRPVGQTEETTDVITNTGTYNNDIDWNAPWVRWMFISLAFVMLLLVIHWLLGWASSRKMIAGR